MQNLYTELKQLLQHDERFLTPNGKLLKNNIVEKALQLDAPLIKLLLTHSALKAHFFETVDNELLVFDKIKFQRFVMNKQFLPDSYTQYKNKIGLVTAQDNDYLTESKEVVLAWPYKDCILEGGQTKDDDRRNETFWNETLAPDQIDRLLTPKVLTNFKQYTPQGEQQTPTQIDTANNNLLIKGNNLLVLHSLLPAYQGKVKLIYIDPPYNTGSEIDSFAYNNSFKHSTWLTFIKNRLQVAKKFLTEDGFIVVAIDHVELFYLGALINEIFGRENQIGLVTVLHNPKGRNLSKFFSANSEFMLVYAKNIELAEFNQVALSEEIKELFNQTDEEGSFRYEAFMRARTVWSRENKPNNWYPIYVSQDLTEITAEKKEDYHELYPITNNGKEMAWKNIRSSFIELNKDGYFIARLEDGKVRIYHKLREQQVYKNVWTDKKYQSEFHGTNLLKKLLGDNKFSYPKSVYLVIDVLKIMTNQNDIVLDFFAGSGTTAQAVLDLNKEDGGDRKFIVCEQMDYIETVTKARICKVMENNQAGNFIYCELLQHNQHYIDQIMAAQSTEQLATIWAAMQERAFLSYRINAKSVHLTDAEFTSLSFVDQQKVLLSLLDKNMLYVPYSEIDDLDWNIAEADKALNKQFYGQQ